MVFPIALACLLLLSIATSLSASQWVFQRLFPHQCVCQCFCSSPHPWPAGHPAVFSLGNKIPRLVSINAESTGVTGVFEGCPVLEGSGRDADPRQRQLLGPSVLAKNDCSSAHRRGASPPARLLHCLPSLSVVPQHPATSHRLRQAKRTLENK